MGQREEKTEEKIKNAFSNATPDILSDILDSIGSIQKEEGDIGKMNNIAYSIDQSDRNIQEFLSDNTAKRNAGAAGPGFKKRSFRTFAGIAAAFVLLVAGFGGYGVYDNNFRVFSKVSLDVNPSLEIDVNKKDRVVDVVPLNGDGVAVIGDMNLKGSDLNLAVNALVGSMVRQGYIDELANSILISVDNSNPGESERLKNEVSRSVEQLLISGGVKGSILSQSIDGGRSELSGLAGTYGITEGKANLINQIVSQNPRYKFGDLVSLTINELNLIRETGGLQLANISSTGSASEGAYIGEAAARKKALEHAGINEGDIYNYHYEMDYENGRLFYEITFYLGTDEYDYEIDAVNGDIIRHQKEWDDDAAKLAGAGNVVPAGGEHGHTEHNNAATSSLSGTDATTSASVKGQGQTSGNSQSTPPAQTGQSSPPNQPAQPTQPVQPAQSTGISAQDALAIAYSHAGVSSGNVYDLEWEQDNEHGNMIYEISFKSGHYEYDYDISASDGRIIKWDKEFDD